jgi:hypothetical protein
VILSHPKETTIGDYQVVCVDYVSPLREGFLIAFDTS